MKKLLLGLGTLASVAAPVAAVIACGSNSSKFEEIKPGATSYAEYQTLATAISGGLKGNIIADDATNLTKVETKGDTVVLTYSSVAPTPADEASDDTTTPANHVKVTLDIGTKKITKVEYKLGDIADWETVDGDALTQLNADTSIIDALEAANSALKPASSTTKTPVDTTAGTTAQTGTGTAGTAGAKPAAVTKDLSLDDKALLDGQVFTAVKNDVLPTDPAKLAGDLKDFIDGSFPDAVAGVTRTYSVTLNKPAEAEVTVTSTETASTARVSTSKFTIKGFIAEQALAKEIQRFLLATTGKKATDPTIAPDKTVDADATLIPTTPFDLDDLSPAEDITLSNAVADTSTGSITADFSAALRGETITGTVKFTGWKSALSPEALAQKAVADLKDEFTHLSAADLKTSESDEQPSAHTSDKTLSSLGISHVPTTSATDTITYALTAKDATGEMDVEATITNGAATDTVNFTITGFQSTTEHNEVVALKAAQATIDTITIDAPVTAITGAVTDGATEYATAKTAYDNAKIAAKAATTSAAVKAQVAKMRTAATEATAGNTKQTAANTTKTKADAAAAKTKAAQDKINGVTEAKLVTALKVATGVKAKDAAKANITGTIPGVKLTVKSVTKNAAAGATDVEVVVTVSSSDTGTTPKDLTVTVKFEANPSAVVTKTEDNVKGLVIFGSANGKATLKARPAWLKTLVFDGAVTDLKDTDKVTVKVTYATGFTGPETVEVQVKTGTEKVVSPTTVKVTNADILTALAAFKKGEAVAKADVKAAIVKLGLTGPEVKVTIDDEKNLSNGDKVTILGTGQEFDLTGGKWVIK